MKTPNPVKLIAAGLAFLLVGFLLLFFMVIRLIAPSFALSFLAYTVCSVGLILGLVGVIQRGQ